MHFNIYLDDKTGKKLNRVVKQTGKTRNALIRAAVTHLLETDRRHWPEEFLGWKGDPGFKGFESFRADLVDQSARDPLE